MVIPYEDSVTCAKFTPNELYIVSAGLDNRVRLWDVRTWKQIGNAWDYQGFQTSTSGGLAHKSDFCVSPNSQYVVVGSAKGWVVVLDISTGELRLEEIF